MADINILDDQAQEQEKPSRFSAHSVIGTVIFVLVLGIVGVFAWRVFGFYRDIQGGAINPALAYTTTDFSRAASAFAAKAAKSGESSDGLLGPNDPSLGTKGARITIVEFADFGCPYTKEAAPVVRAIAKQYAKDVELIVRDFPIDDLHPGATIAAQGGGCANEQGKFWEYYDAILASKDSLNVDSVTAIAEGVGVNTAAFSKCLDSGYYAKDVAGDLADGAAVGVVGTPTFFFNGQKVEGSIPFNVFNQIIDAMRKT